MDFEDAIDLAIKKLAELGHDVDRECQQFSQYIGSNKYYEAISLLGQVKYLVNLEALARNFPFLGEIMRLPPLTKEQVDHILRRINDKQA